MRERRSLKSPPRSAGLETSVDSGSERGESCLAALEVTTTCCPLRGVDPTRHWTPDTHKNVISLLPKLFDCSSSFLMFVLPDSPGKNQKNSSYAVIQCDIIQLTRHISCRLTDPHPT